METYLGEYRRRLKPDVAAADNYGALRSGINLRHYPVHIGAVTHIVNT